MKYTSALTTDASGHVNGLVASRNTYGRYFRQRVTPTNPNTTRQGAARTLFATVSAGWRALTKALQATWNNGAAVIVKTDALGNPITLSGQAAFMSVNRRQETAGLAQFSECPVDVRTTPDTPTATFSASTGVLTVNFGSAPTNGGKYVVKGSDVFGVGINYIAAPQSVLGTTDTATFSASPTSPGWAGEVCTKASGSAAGSQIALAAYSAGTDSAPSPDMVTRVPLA